ncbi:unnamed protein product [Linum trigynum]|uniref:Uncharacterized protein n=1 Tax=Linum trigynum TaxID=586398 RepID=A0AAV2C9C6_9ROSI
MVSLPSLKNFKMIRFGNHVKPLVVIGAPNLEELHLQEFGKLELMGSSPLTCLHSAYIDIGEHQSSDLAGVLNRISNAKKMFLSGNTLRRLSVADNVQLPVFPKLTHLTIGIWGSSYTLFSLLNSASKLQYLVIDMVSPHVHLLVGMVEWLVLQHLPTPECLLSSLEEVEIKHLVVAEDTKKLLHSLWEEVQMEGVHISWGKCNSQGKCTCLVKMQ